MNNDFKKNPKQYYSPMHTAEHILNQTMVRKFNRGRSFSNHIEKKKSKCDYHFDRNLTADEITDIEKTVNKVISSNLDVVEEFITKAEAEQKYNLKNLPEHVDETVRIIKIGNYDACPCSGDHVKNTSEVGSFKIVSTSFENNILRIRFKLDHREN